MGTGVRELCVCHGMLSAVGRLVIESDELPVAVLALGMLLRQSRRWKGIELQLDSELIFCSTSLWCNQTHGNTSLLVTGTSGQNQGSKSPITNAGENSIMHALACSSNSLAARNLSNHKSLFVQTSQSAQ